MIEFNWLEGFVRKHFRLYLVLRWLAPSICKFIDLEDGFAILSKIRISNPNLVAVDVGCNDGTSLTIIRRYLPKTRIIAVDPIQKPKISDANCEYLQIALGKSKVTQDIFIPIVRGHRLTQYSSFEASSLISSVSHDTKIDASEISVSTRKVSVETLDDLGLQPLFIKIDVEGAELAVLEGSRDTIQKFKPIVLLEIQNEERYAAIEKFFKVFDYRNINTGLERLPSGNLREDESFNPKLRNYIWVPDNCEGTWLK
jgi:FkbM family methyltransferase